MTVFVAPETHIDLFIGTSLVGPASEDETAMACALSSCNDALWVALFWGNNDLSCHQHRELCSALPVDEMAR